MITPLKLSLCLAGCVSLLVAAPYGVSRFVHRDKGAGEPVAGGAPVSVASVPGRSDVIELPAPSASTRTVPPGSAKTSAKTDHAKINVSPSISAPAPAPKIEAAAPAPPKPELPYRPEVARAQELLARVGKETGKVDGRLGEKTAASLKAFQQKNGLKDSGDADPATMTKLEDLAAAAAPAPAPPARVETAAAAAPTLAVSGEPPSLSGREIASVPTASSKKAVDDPQFVVLDASGAIRSAAPAPAPAAAVAPPPAAPVAAAPEPEATPDASKLPPGAELSAKGKIIYRVTDKERESAIAATAKYDAAKVPSTQTVAEVLSVQQALVATGVYSYVPDGKWGDKTKEALKEFQRSKSLEDTGKPDSATWQQLLAGAEAARKSGKPLNVTVSRPSAAAKAPMVATTEQPKDTVTAPRAETKPEASSKPAAQPIASAAPAVPGPIEAPAPASAAPVSAAPVTAAPAQVTPSAPAGESARLLANVPDDKDHTGATAVAAPVSATSTDADVAKAPAPDVNPAGKDATIAIAVPKPGSVPPPAPAATPKPEIAAAAKASPATRSLLGPLHPTSILETSQPAPPAEVSPVAAEAPVEAAQVSATNRQLSLLERLTKPAATPHMSLLSERRPGSAVSSASGENPTAAPVVTPTAITMQSVSNSPGAGGAAATPAAAASTDPEVLPSVSSTGRIVASTADAARTNPPATAASDGTLSGKQIAALPATRLTAPSFKNSVFGNPSQAKAPVPNVSKSRELERQMTEAQTRVTAMGVDPKLEVNRYAPVSYAAARALLDKARDDMKNGESTELQRTLQSMDQQLAKAQTEAAKSKADAKVTEVDEAYKGLKSRYAAQIRRRSDLADVMTKIDTGFQAMHADYKKGSYDPILTLSDGFKMSIEQVRTEAAKQYVDETLKNSAATAKIPAEIVQQAEQLRASDKSVEAADLLAPHVKSTSSSDDSKASGKSSSKSIKIENASKSSKTSSKSSSSGKSSKSKKTSSSSSKKSSKRSR